MTKALTEEQKRRIGFKGIMLAVLATALPILALFFADAIRSGVERGLSLLRASIIPSVFPFMILSSFFCQYAPIDHTRTAARLFERCFGISGCGLRAFLTGLLCGFPLGLKETVDLYNRGALSKSEAERLCAFANNTGPAFVIIGIGLCMRGSIRDGILLYTVMLLSAVLVGVLCRGQGIQRYSGDEPLDGQFHLSLVIRESALSMLFISGYILFFSILIAVLKEILGEGILFVLLVTPLEVGTAASVLSTDILPSSLSLVLSAFSISFSGLSVGMQSEGYLKDAGLSVRKYYYLKLLQGVLSMLLVAILSPLFDLFFVHQ